MKSYRLPGEGELSSPGTDHLIGYSIPNCQPLTHARKNSITWTQWDMCVCVCVFYSFVYMYMYQK